MIEPKTNRIFIQYLSLSLAVLFTVLFACKKIEHKKILKITTGEITDTTTTTVTVKGVIIDAGEEGINEHGHCWSTSQNPTVSLSTKTELGSNNSAGSFTSKLTDLSPGTTYYVKAYATNSKETVYGNEIIFSASDTLPIVSTSPAGNITWNSATSGGIIIDNGGATISARGVCWSSSQNPTIADAFTTDGSGTGSFTSSITGLTPNTIYYLRAYATNSEGTGYGDEIMFKTYGVLTDLRDGQEYKTTEIGEQWWMAENLNFYTSSSSWYYDNDSTTHSETYGRLYTWETAKNVCPAGWHLPDDSEWKDLEMHLGMTQVQADNTGWRGTDQGVQLSIDGNSRFEALLAGYRFYTGAFYDLGTSAYFWSSTEASCNIP